LFLGLTFCCLPFRALEVSRPPPLGRCDTSSPPFRPFSYPGCYVLLVHAVDSPLCFSLDVSCLRMGTQAKTWPCIAFCNSCFFALSSPVVAPGCGPFYAPTLPPLHCRHHMALPLPPPRPCACVHYASTSHVFALRPFPPISHPTNPLNRSPFPQAFSPKIIPLAASNRNRGSSPPPVVLFHAKGLWPTFLLIKHIQRSFPLSFLSIDFSPDYPTVFSISPSGTRTSYLSTNWTVQKGTSSSSGRGHSLSIILFL